MNVPSPRVLSQRHSSAPPPRPPKGWGRPPAAVFDSLSSGLSVGGQACADQGPTFALDQDLGSLVANFAGLSPGQRGPQPCPSPLPPPEALLSLLCLHCEARGPHRSGVAVTSRGCVQVHRGPSAAPPLCSPYLTLCNYLFLVLRPQTFCSLKTGLQRPPFSVLSTNSTSSPCR